MEEVLVLFSGGLDSLLTSCLLIEKGYKILLVHYDNGFSYGSSFVKESVERLIGKYGKEKVTYWGVGDVSGYFYTLRVNSFLWKRGMDDIVKNYPELYIPQCYCLICRTSMYIFSILLSKKLKIEKVAEGARKSQLFAIEQPEMIEEYRKLLYSYGIELLLPVYDLDSDLEREQLLMIRNFNPKVMESKCMLGCPIDKSLNPLEIENVVRYYKQELLGPTRMLIKESEKIPLDNRGRIF